MARQLRAGGCPEEEIAKLAGRRAEDDDEDFGIWPENADALRAFLFSETQWNVVGTFGGVHWLGLKYEAVERAFKNHPPENEVDAWDALRVLEAEAVRLRNSKNGND